MAAVAGGSRSRSDRLSTTVIIVRRSPLITTTSGPFDSHKLVILTSLILIGGLKCHGFVQASDFDVHKWVILLSVNLMSGLHCNGFVLASDFGAYERFSCPYFFLWENCTVSYVSCPSMKLASFCPRNVSILTIAIPVTML